MYLHNNLKFDTHAQHTIDDVQYPRGWFLDASNRERLGVTEVPDPVRPDDALFETVENPDGTLTSTARTPEAIAQRAQFMALAFQSAVVTATQARLDDFARTRNYDGILSACTYATSAVAKFHAEGQAAVDLRDSTWATLYLLMAEVEGGTRTMPATVNEVLALLPELVWPV